MLSSTMRAVRLCKPPAFDTGLETATPERFRLGSCDITALLTPHIVRSGAKTELTKRQNMRHWQIANHPKPSSGCHSCARLPHPDERPERAARTAAVLLSMGACGVATTTAAMQATQWR